MISCFVGDRLPSQIKGLDHLNPHSLQNKFYDEPLYSSVLYIPCICHIFNRALLKVIQKNTQLQKAVNLLNSLQVLLRKPCFYTAIKKFMPSIVETRWVYLFDIAFWALANKSIINSILEKSTNPIVKKYFKIERFAIFEKGIPPILDEVVFIMLPIKAFFDKMENQKAALWWIRPLFNQLIDNLRNVSIDLNILSEECDQIISQFENDYFNLARTELIDVAFSFTSIGRNFFRKNFFESSIKDAENCYPDEPKLDYTKYLSQLSEHDSFLFLNTLN